MVNYLSERKPVIYEKKTYLMVDSIGEVGEVSLEAKV